MCEELDDVDVDELLKDVTSHVDSCYHTTFFKERTGLWEHMKTTTGAALKSLVCTAVAAFVKMYGQYWKGKERYTRLLLAWYKVGSPNMRQWVL